MNAIIGLCHFCEAHGPRPLFCTFSTDNEKHVTESSISSAQCTGCTSVGPETVYVSKDDDNAMLYCSRESVPNTDVADFLRQAATRSITCEVNWNKDGGVIYFNDTRGHVLSFTFQLKDTRARGLKRWFSIVVLMKDKMLLLSLTPMLSDHMKKIAKELQDSADKVFDREQEICSQRALRLKTGRNDFGPSRCLSQLTGEEEVFKKLHGRFTWMLKAGGVTYTETLYTSRDLLNKMDPGLMNASIFTPNVCRANADGCMAFRTLESLLSKNTFRILLYCTLTGIDIVIKSNQPECDIIARTLLKFLPDTNHSSKILVNRNDNRSSSAGLCILEMSEDKKYNYVWPGSLPSKCPTLMTRIERAMDNSKFENSVLNQHIKFLQLEWLGIAQAVKYAIDSSGIKSDPVVKLKQVFGVTLHDEILLSYWIKEFCS